jgi:carboxymethylenebutenolidase
MQESKFEEIYMGSMITYMRPDGQSATAYLVQPQAGALAPAIVVIQEWWGLNEQIKEVAHRLAQQGYQAIVPDLYKGKIALEENEANHLMTGLDFADAASQDIRGAIQYLKAAGAPKVGVTGFCMGGALTLLSAIFAPEIDAAAIWYGYPPLEFVDADKIKAPLMGSFAIYDDVFPISGVDALEAKLSAARVDYVFDRYEAKHAFANEEADTKNLPYLKYDPQAAGKAWEKTTAFFRNYIN